MRVGFAERDITPAIGSEQPGGYSKKFHKSVHDPCKVRAAVFIAGEESAAIVGVDALIIPRQVAVAARAAIEKRCRIAPGSVMIAASHSHSSGPVGMTQPGEYDHAPALVQDLAYKQASAADPEYLARVTSSIADAVCAALGAAAEALCGFGSGIEDKVAFNRRFRMRDGITHTHPGQGNPNIVELAGPTDPEVGVVGAWDKSGKLLGAIVNFACHATTSPGGISANYICYLEQVIRGAFGQDVVVVFTAGACGDVTQVDNLSPTVQRKGEDWARFVGGRVGAEAVKVLLSLETTADVTVASRSSSLQIARRPPRAERVRAALQLVQNPPANADMTEVTFARETILLDAKIQKEPVAEVEVQAIQIGPAVFVANPAEYFCQYGLDIKKGSPFPLTFPVELANGCVGYVPTEEALGPHGGGYETRLTSYSNLIPAAGRLIAEESIRLTKQFAADRLPARPPHPPFKGDGWSYGNVPPQVD